jgi:N-acetylmuramoyl-L-alanine amidase
LAPSRSSQPDEPQSPVLATGTPATAVSVSTRQPLPNMTSQAPEIKTVSLPPAGMSDGAPPVLSVPRTVREFVVVLDPGHGGKDPGAVSSDGSIKEKDITLEIAKRVKRGLSASNSALRVELTRTADQTLALEERTAQANASNADLFISIHCNADTDSSSKGVETFYLSKATSRRALRVAARENGISPGKMTDLEATLLDLMLASKKSESDRLARTVHSSLMSTMRSVIPSLRDRGVKSAPFYVLLGAQMPAILVECGFISNRRDREELTSPAFLESAAKGITKGAADYLKGL